MDFDEVVRIRKVVHKLYYSKPFTIFRYLVYAALTYLLLLLIILTPLVKVNNKDEGIRLLSDIIKYSNFDILELCLDNPFAKDGNSSSCFIKPVVWCIN